MLAGTGRRRQVPWPGRGRPAAALPAALRHAAPVSPAPRSKGCWGGSWTQAWGMFGACACKAAVTEPSDHQAAGLRDGADGVRTARRRRRGDRGLSHRTCASCRASRSARQAIRAPEKRMATGGGRGRLRKAGGQAPLELPVHRLLGLSTSRTGAEELCNSRRRESVALGKAGPCASARKKGAQQAWRPRGESALYPSHQFMCTAASWDWHFTPSQLGIVTEPWGCACHQAGDSRTIQKAGSTGRVGSNTAAAVPTHCNARL